MRYVHAIIEGILEANNGWNTCGNVVCGKYAEAKRLKENRYVSLGPGDEKESN